MVYLLPDLPGIYIDPAAEGSVDSQYSKALLAGLLPRLRDEVPNLTVIGAPYLGGQVPPFDFCDVLSSSPDDFVQDAPLGFPPTLELHFDRMPCAGGIKTGKDYENLTRGTCLRDKLTPLAGSLNGCWDTIRGAWETSSLSAVFGYTPHISFATLREAVCELEKRVDEISSELSNTLKMLESLVCPGIVDGWIRSKIKPMRDQISMLEHRANMLEVWIEAE
jgi:hypothetical protein